jgi:molybdopterin converting factor small subunit
MGPKLNLFIHNPDGASASSGFIRPPTFKPQPEAMMQVQVKSFAALITKGKVEHKTLNMDDKATAADVMRKLGIDPDDEIMVLINQCPSMPESTVSDGDKITLMPPVSAA